MKEARIKFGKGKGNGYNLPLGTLEAQMGKKHLKMTLEDIGKQLAKQAEIVDGELLIIGIEFTYYKRKEGGR